MLAAASCLCVGALIGPSFFTTQPVATRTRVPMASDDDTPDSFNFDLLKLPRLTTPEQAGFDRYRERQQKRTRGNGPTDLADMAAGDPNAPTPLGLDPVEGDPVDLNEYLQGNEDAFAEPTLEDIAAANAEFEQLTRGEEPDGFGDGIDGLFK